MEGFLAGGLCVAPPWAGGMLTAEGMEPRPGTTGGRNGLGLGPREG